MSARTINHTLTANVVATVTLDMAYPRVEVVNRDGSTELFFTADGSAPVLNGDNCWCVPPSSYVQVPAVNSGSQTILKIVSSGAVAFSASGMNAFEIIRSNV